jgi:glycosyltransferase involved in cell wall biosynthesis
MSTRTADLSVIIPTYNRPQLLEPTIRSVLAQTMVPREIVVVDNGTNDDTATMLRRFEGSVTVIRQPPQGVQAARNAGMAVARSDWFALLDDDDLYRPDFIETLQAPIIDGRADIICCDHRKFEGDQPRPQSNFEAAPAGYWEGVKPVDPEDWSFIGSFPVERLLHFMAFFPSTMALRRTLFERTGGYDPRMRGIIAEDAEFLVRALLAGQLAIVWRVLVDYRLHEANDSGRRSGGYNGQALGRWRVFEALRQNPSVTDPGFRAALNREMPRLRARAFDGAFGTRDFNTVSSLSSELRPSDWTYKRRLKKYAAIAANIVMGGFKT